MKICYVVGHFYPHVGGVEKLFLDYATGMVEKGNQVRVVTSNSGGITGKKEYKGIEVYYYSWPIMFGHPIVKKEDLITHIEWADLVHTTTFTVAPPVRNICYKKSKPVIITILEVLGNKWHWIEKNPIKACIFRLCETYVCSQRYSAKCVDSEATKNDYLNYLNNKDIIFKVYCSIDDNLSKIASESAIHLRELFQVNNKSRCFLYYGRPGQSKGIFVYLNAIHRLKEKYSEAILENVTFCFLMSDDPLKEKKRFLKQVRKFSLEKFIKVMKSVKREELLKCIQEADYIVVPSITEGFGFSAAEACALGRPLIHSNAGSLPEIAYGKVLSFQNQNVDDLADCLYKVIIDGEKAFQDVPKKSFTKKEMIESLSKIYCQLLND